MKNKLLGILLILIMLIVVMPSNVFADYGGINTDIEIGDTGAIDSSVDITESIVGTLQMAGSVISIIALIIIGMRYMFSSIEEKAQMKGVLGYYIAGCVLSFATSNLLSFAYNIIDDVKHSWESRRVEPTCTAYGYVQTWCTDCGESNISWIDPLGHSYGNWTTKTAATCTAAKVQKHSCTRCGHTETRNSGSALGHSYGSWTTKTAATCTSAKVQKRNCTRCGIETTRTSGSALGHNYGSWTTKKAATCTAAKVEKRTCTRCSNEDTRNSGSALGHNMGSWTTTQSPTCTSSGRKTKSCSRCSYSETGSIASLGHNYEWYWQNPVYGYNKCTRCGKKK